MPVRRQTELPAPNDSFYPPKDARSASEFSGLLHIAQSPLETRPRLKNPRIEGRDAGRLPRITLGFVTAGDVLVPLQRGQIVSQRQPGETASYWSVIPQFGRVWRDPGDEGPWSRAAFPLMLVGDTENHSHQGVATFRYKEREVSELEFQFVQQTAPYLLHQHFIGWGRARMKFAPLAAREAALHRESARSELARRLPHRPWRDLVRETARRSLEGFGGPVREQWRVLAAVDRKSVV